MIEYPTIEDTIGDTPLVELVRIPSSGLRKARIRILGKLEGNNPAGSVKDRPALSMISRAEARGDITPGDTLIEATSGNTGIALAMAAAIRGYRMILVMPENQSLERRQAMKAYGAELLLVTKEQGIEGARDLAERIQAEGKGRVLDQFGNDDNWASHYEGTGPELWRQTQGTITHFVSAMGTTGTITGVSRYLKERSQQVQIVGAQPEEGSSIAGIRKWPPEYLPAIYRHAKVDRLEYVSQQDAEEMAREMAAKEGIFCGISAAGACLIALRVAEEHRERMAADTSLAPATIVFVVCDRGDRYLSTGVFPG